MRRPITIAIAAMGLIALMFWLGMGATGKDAAVVNAPLKPEYACRAPWKIAPSASRGIAPSLG